MHSFYVELEGGCVTLLLEVRFVIDQQDLEVSK